MIFSITVCNNDKDYNNMYDNIGRPIHKEFIGTMDYIKSNVVLTLEKGKDHEPVCSVFIDASSCVDKETMREKLQNAIDVVMDNI